jgi:dTDP-4-dehydrorhamnose reductase
MGGGSEKDKKFINAIVYKLIKSGVKEFPSITDSYGHPTYTYDLAKTIKNMIEGNAEYGIYNVGGLGIASRYEMAKTFVEYLGADVKIIPITCEEYHKDHPKKVEYWSRSVMDLSEIQNSGFSAMRPWKEALKEYAEQFKPCHAAMRG